MSDYEVGDLQYPFRLVKQKGGAGLWVYLPKEHLSLALFGKPQEDIPDGLTATRTVLDKGTSQILVRIKKA